MNELAPRLTDNGKAFIIGALNGDGIVFTKIVIGNGVPTDDSPTALANQQMVIGLTDIDVHESYCILTGKFDNANIGNGFYMNELGVMAKNTDETEVLYAYRYLATNVDYIPAAASGDVIETEISVIVSIGDAEDVTAVLIEGSLYASKEDFQNHVNNFENPHHVTKEQVGLGNVENLVFGENVPTISDLEDAENIGDGDTLDEIVSKLKFWIRRVAESSYIPTSGYGNAITPNCNNTDGIGITGDLWFADCGNHGKRGIGGHMSGNDSWRIIAGSDSSISPINTAGATEGDCGYLEIATADNGNEPILVRQWVNANGKAFSSARRTLFLLDKDGNTKVPGELQFFGGYRGIKWSNNESPNPTGTTNGDGAYIGLVQNPAKTTDDLEIAAGDDGNEQIMVRQRKFGTNIGIGGAWTSMPITRTAYLLNTSGNTIFPGSCTATSHPTSSDLKKKDVHGEVDPATAEALIMGLVPIWYNFKDDWKESAGFGAQDVYSLVHELGMVDSGLYRAALKPDADGNAEGIEYHDAEIDAHDDSELEWNLNYTEFIPYMVRVIQSQQKKIESLEERITALEKKLGGD